MYGREQNKVCQFCISQHQYFADQFINTILTVHTRIIVLINEIEVWSQNTWKYRTEDFERSASLSSFKKTFAFWTAHKFLLRGTVNEFIER